MRNNIFKALQIYPILDLQVPPSEPFTKQQILDATKLKEHSHDNFKFDESGRKFSKKVENSVGKKRNYSLGAISPFPTVYEKAWNCRHVKSRACLGKS